MDRRTRERLGDGAWILRGAALSSGHEIVEAIDSVATQAPFRRMETPGGFLMSVAMTNCGLWGWVSDRTGYRYSADDPHSLRPWPHMPACFDALARSAANEAGYPDFEPDACLINRYEPGASLSLHQDRNERDLSAPIVSVSFGLPAQFLFGGLKRTERPQRVAVFHGDVVVWGGPSRLAFHGVSKLKDGEHPLLGRRRVNLTFRRARS